MSTATLPRITSQGLELDTSSEAFGFLRESSDIADDFPALRERMQEDGYLYIPGYLNRDEVLDARTECLRRIAERGMIDESYPLNEGVTSEKWDPVVAMELAAGNEPMMNLLYSGRMMEFHAGFLGQEVRHFDYTWVRAVGKGKGTPPHTDIVYMGRGTKNLWTTWTALGDTSMEMGGLVILENSHTIDRIKNGYGSKDVDAYCINRRSEGFVEMGGGGNIQSGGALTFNPVKLRHNLKRRWLTAPEFRMGDLLVFGMYTIHCSLDNATDRIRLSTDSRYQPASEPADERWIGPNPIAHGPEAKRGFIC